ncbi:MAG: ATP synthase subunit I [Rhodoferax sp.]|nr:ATP synthase subunit I [Rhodoferax sp.]MBP7492659.1 ATP synthase subunit I [Rhodoferax sp.]
MTPDADKDLGGFDDLEFKQLTAEEVKFLRHASRPVSPWQVVALQALVGFTVAVLAWVFTGKQLVGWSAAYGSLAVVLPAVIFVRGLARQQGAPNAGSALGGFFMWEMVKIALTVAMLFAAPRVVLSLNWLALLAGFVVTMKVYWVAMWLHSRRNKSVANIH